MPDNIIIPLPQLPVGPCGPIRRELASTLALTLLGTLLARTKIVRDSFPASKQREGDYKRIDDGGPPFGLPLFHAGKTAPDARSDRAGFENLVQNRSVAVFARTRTTKIIIRAASVHGALIARLLTGVARNIVGVPHLRARRRSAPTAAQLTL